MGLALLAHEEPGAFDFWLGEWDCTWPAGGRGTNSVYADLGGRAIVESFDGRPSRDFQGISLTAYDAEAGVWRQLWTDSEGNVLVFEGGPRADGTVELRTADDRHRMRFTDITGRGFEWRYERSDDGGSSWRTVWPISYRRVV